MSMKLYNKINTYALKQVEGKKPIINNYIIDADIDTFCKLYNNNETFVQATLYEKINYSRVKFEIYLAHDNWEALKQQINNYNDALKEAQIKAVEVAKMVEEYIDEKTYYYFNRVGDDLGIRIYSAHIRNKEIEEKQRQERIKEHEHLMQTDAEYRMEYNWHNEEYRPFGGAFASWDDYYNYKK